MTKTSEARLTQHEGEALYELDLLSLGERADARRRALHGNKVFFNSNRHEFCPFNMPASKQLRVPLRDSPAPQKRHSKHAKSPFRSSR